MWFFIVAHATEIAPFASEADELVKLEKFLRRTDTTPAEVTESAIRQQALYRQFAHDAEGTKFLLESVAKIDADSVWIVETNLTATKKISHTVKNLKSTVPDWTIDPPLPAEQLILFYQEAETVHGVPWEVIAAINMVETRMGRLKGTSWAGAQGPMQFMPPTWKGYGKGDVTDPHDAILGAGNYLKEMGAERDLDKAIWHYNHSDDYVAAVRGFAAVLEKNPEAFRGYWGWQVYYKTTAGTVLLPEGYHQDKPIDVKTWCADTPSCTL